jgi:hypothetical protein
MIDKEIKEAELMKDIMTPPAPAPGQLNGINGTGNGSSPTGGEATEGE